jgi:cellulose synthase/poly-beta-1,6-N-acetylglucosamine synthase-like glycosyltransferase
MDALVSALLIISAALVSLPVITFFVEVGAAIAFPKPGEESDMKLALRPRAAVLIPAHNESANLVPTLEDIKRQLRAGDRLLLVADNCTDDTAAIAAAANVEVVERHDSTKIGKAYALEFGLRHLSKEPPEIVVMIDADCRLAESAIDRLTHACASTQQPIQALYMMAAPSGSNLNYQVAEFAWRVKNWVRPLGLSALNLPCQLMGSGMAFPWDVIRSADLSGGWIVEDLKLGLDLALAGHPAKFLPSARVDSTFAPSAKGAEIQRSRWEQGHIAMILSTAPRLVWTGLSRGNFGLLALALDLAVPPLALLGLLAIGMFAISTLAALLDITYIALLISAVTLIGFTLPIILAWFEYGRKVLPFSAILSIPVYIMGKMRLYITILSGKSVSTWIRTDRR